MAETKFKPGDVVMVDGQVEAIIVYELDPLQCLMHVSEDEKDHFEWSNLFTLKGEWLFHVGECQMEYSEFGRNLRTARN